MEATTWKFRLTPNDPDFSGSVETDNLNSKPICEVYSERHGHLLAAAPEMYEVLKKIRDIADLSTSLEMAVYGLIDICDEIDQALAKARGEVNQPNEQ